MVKSLCMALVYCPGLTCIQEGWQYHSLVDFQLGVKLDSISLPDICTETCGAYSLKHNKVILLCFKCSKRANNSKMCLNRFKCFRKVPVPKHINILDLDYLCCNVIEPLPEKTNNLGFQPGLTQTRLYSHRLRLGA